MCTSEVVQIHTNFPPHQICMNCCEIGLAPLFSGIFLIFLDGLNNRSKPEKISMFRKEVPQSTPLPWTNGSLKVFNWLSKLFRIVCYGFKILKFSFGLVLFGTMSTSCVFYECVRLLVPLLGNFEPCPLGVDMGERRQRDPCLKHTYIKTPLVGWRMKQSGSVSSLFDNR